MFDTNIKHVGARVFMKKTFRKSYEIIKQTKYVKVK